MRRRWRHLQATRRRLRSPTVDPLLLSALNFGTGILTGGVVAIIRIVR
jgi:hypothetical protein